MESDILHKDSKKDSYQIMKTKFGQSEVMKLWSKIRALKGENISPGYSLFVCRNSITSEWQS